VGRERSRPGQYLYLCIAGLIILTACAPLGMMGARQDSYAHLKPVRQLLRQGDFEGALRENQKILSLFPGGRPGDAALFNMGLIHAHYANPKKDYKKALSFFTRLEREFPGSPLVEEAKIWTGVLQAMERSKQVDLEIEEKKKELAK
jgi:outer membrane protein assembly factor BamD (BamD/ComL family)